jgi:glycosyltransferase involved in cell wall biosynthesis
VKVSVIIPVYNGRAYIAEAIDSVLAQTRPADEVIVVDDGSTDGVGEVLDRYGANLRVVRQGNRGPAAALNTGLAVTTGDTIAFLDADDLWTRDKLRQQCEALAEDPSLDGVFGYVEQFISPDAAASVADRYAVPDRPQPGISRDALLIRMSAFQRFGVFDASLGAGEFVAWYSRAVASGLNAKVISTVVARRRIHLTNTGIVRREQQQQESLAGLKQALDIRRGRTSA